MAIRITIWKQGLFSGFVTIGRYRYEQLLTDINLLLIQSFIHTDSPDGETDIATLVRRALTEVCTVPVFLVMVALWNRADHYIFILWFLSIFFIFFFSSPNLSGRRLDVYHTLAHGVALVRI